MAHLIKLEDYISRYQSDLQRYPNQFARLKKERWNHVKSNWEHRQSTDYIEPILTQEEEGDVRKGIFSQAFNRVKTWKSSKKESQADQPVVKHEYVNPNLSLAQLKEQFYDELFRSQLRWASSSLLEESSLHPRYKRDNVLKFFSQQLPDNYFVMYRPVFFIKKAPIELEIIVIAPNEVMCVSVLDGQEHSVFEASSERFWTEFIDETRKKRISPLLSLSRMSGVIQPILEEAGINCPLRKVVLATNGIIDHRIQGTKTELIDYRNKEVWHEKLKKNPTPIKLQQKKIAELLLAQTHTLSYKRQEDEIDQETENYK